MVVTKSDTIFSGSFAVRSHDSDLHPDSPQTISVRLGFSVTSFSF
jgi:hypothetical protein